MSSDNINEYPQKKSDIFLPSYMEELLSVIEETENVTIKELLDISDTIPTLDVFDYIRKNNGEDIEKIKIITKEKILSILEKREENKTKLLELDNLHFGNRTELEKIFGLTRKKLARLIIRSNDVNKIEKQPKIIKNTLFCYEDLISLGENFEKWEHYYLIKEEKHAAFKRILIDTGIPRPILLDIVKNYPVRNQEILHRGYTIKMYCIADIEKYYCEKVQEEKISDNGKRLELNGKSYISKTCLMDELGLNEASFLELRQKVINGEVIHKPMSNGSMNYYSTIDYFIKIAKIDKEIRLYYIEGKKYADIFELARFYNVSESIINGDDFPKEVKSFQHKDKDLYSIDDFEIHIKNTKSEVKPDAKWINFIEKDSLHYGTIVELIKRTGLKRYSVWSLIKRTPNCKSEEFIPKYSKTHSKQTHYCYEDLIVLGKNYKKWLGFYSLNGKKYTTLDVMKKQKEFFGVDLKKFVYINQIKRTLKIKDKELYCHKDITDKVKEQNKEKYSKKKTEFYIIYKIKKVLGQKDDPNTRRILMGENFQINTNGKIDTSNLDMRFIRKELSEYYKNFLVKKLLRLIINDIDSNNQLGFTVSTISIG